MAAVFGFTDSYQTGFDAEDQVIEGLWAGNQVEGRWEGPTLVEVGEPQLGSCKFPLHVSILLRKMEENPFIKNGLFGVQFPLKKIYK